MKKILLIEDNPEVSENTSEILELAGFSVLAAMNGKQGVELAQKEIPDLIICDIMMPELDGFGVLDTLQRQKETSTIPFIFLTAKAEKVDVRNGTNRGADDYIIKPFNDTDLLNAVDIRIQKSSLIKDHYAPDANGLDTFIDDARKFLNLPNLCQKKETRLLKKRSILFSEGEVPLYVYFLKSGHIKTFKSHAAGKQLITNIHHVNESFGFEPILEGCNYRETAEAIQDSELIAIPKADFITLLDKHPVVSKAFVSLLCKKIATREQQLLTLAYSSVRQRTAAVLLDIYQHQSEVAPISRNDLAQVVGSSPEAVIRVLSDLASEKLIEIEGPSIQILQAGKLEKVVRRSIAR